MTDNAVQSLDRPPGRSLLDSIQSMGWTDRVIDALAALGGEADLFGMCDWLMAQPRRRALRPDGNWHDYVGNVFAVLVCHCDGRGDNLFRAVGSPEQLTFGLVDRLSAAPSLARLVKRAVNRRYDSEFTGTDRYLLGLSLYELGRYYTAAGLIEQALADTLDHGLATNAQRLLELCLVKLEN